jgi:hypothetical protein
MTVEVAWANHVMRVKYLQGEWALGGCEKILVFAAALAQGSKWAGVSGCMRFWTQPMEGYQAKPFNLWGEQWEFLESANDRPYSSAMQAKHDAAQPWWRVSVTLNPNLKPTQKGRIWLALISLTGLSLLQSTKLRFATFDYASFDLSFASIPFHYV